MSDMARLNNITGNSMGTKQQTNNSTSRNGIFRAWGCAETWEANNCLKEMYSYISTNLYCNKAINVQIWWKS